MSELITPTSLKDLVHANAIRQATVVAENHTFKLVVKYGMTERTVSVRSRDGKINERVFSSLDSVARFIKEKIHLATYEVNAANYQPVTEGKTGKRPDSSKFLKEAHAARAHNEWLRTELEASRADPRPAISNDEAKRQSAANLERLRLKEAAPAPRKTAARKKTVAA